MKLYMNFKNNLLNTSGEINIYLTRITSEQSGLYTCIVENALGKVNQSLYLEVQCKLKIFKFKFLFLSNIYIFIYMIIFVDTPRVSIEESRLIVNHSDSTILRCYVDSNPLPYQIIWFKNGYEILKELKDKP